jgi:hypothetical protein
MHCRQGNFRWGAEIQGRRPEELRWIQEFVADRPDSLCHKFAFPSGQLPGRPSAGAVSTRLFVIKSLHGSGDRWITAKLHYVDSTGHCAGVLGTCHLYMGGSETLEVNGVKVEMAADGALHEVAVSSDSLTRAELFGRPVANSHKAAATVAAASGTWNMSAFFLHSSY